MPLEEQDLVNNYLQCPVCKTPPLSKVYQCINGHILCDNCIEKVGQKCPQCWTPFGVEKIRALTVETILDAVVLQCPMDQYGCFQTMKRHEVKAHGKICKAREIAICPNLGYRECKHKVRSGDALIKHLQKTHTHGALLNKTISKKEVIITTKANYFENIYLTQPFVEVRFVSAEFSGELEQFLIVVNQGSSGKNLKCGVLYMGDEPLKAKEFIAKIELGIVHGRTHETIRIRTCTTPTVHYKAAENKKAIPYFGTSLDYLKGRAYLRKRTDFDLVIKVELAEEQCTCPPCVSRRYFCEKFPSVALALAHIICLFIYFVYS